MGVILEIDSNITITMTKTIKHANYLNQSLIGLVLEILDGMFKLLGIPFVLIWIPFNRGNYVMESECKERIWLLGFC